MHRTAGLETLTPAQAKREAETLPKRRLLARAQVIRRYVGKPICTWCLAPLTGRRSSWCGQECVDAYFLVHDWKAIRAAVFERDKGICRHCRRDTQKAERVHRDVLKRAFDIDNPKRGYYQFDVRRLIPHTNPRVQRLTLIALRIADAYGFGPQQSTARDWWEADHIVERVRGGRDHLDNLRTLCLRCHKVETARLARERADERQERKKAPPAG